MRHGNRPHSDEKCEPKNVVVTVGNRSMGAIDACICGLAEFEGFDVASTEQELRDEIRMLELDQPEVEVVS